MVQYKIVEIKKRTPQNCKKWLKGKIEKYIRSINECKREVGQAKHVFEKNLCAELDELKGKPLVNCGKKPRGSWVMMNVIMVDYNKVVDIRGNLIEGKDNVMGIGRSISTNS